jgi:hypothetical protein
MEKPLTAPEHLLKKLSIAESSKVVMEKAIFLFGLVEMEVNF